MHNHIVVSFGAQQKKKSAHYIKNIPTSLASMSRSLRDLAGSSTNLPKKKKKEERGKIKKESLVWQIGAGHGGATV
jgi:hypothetical protein